MSLILDALKKAKELTNRKPAPPPAALASFRFGRPSRSEKTKRVALFGNRCFVMRQGDHVGIEARHRLGIDPGVDQEAAHRAMREAHGVAPTRVVEGRRDGPVLQALTSSRWNTI